MTNKRGLKMKRYFALLLILFSASSFAYDYDMYQSAKRLNDAAWNLVNRIEHKSSLSHLSDEARYLANRISEFKSSVRHGASNWRVRRNFELVERAYRDMNGLLHRNRWARHYPSVKRDVNRLRDHFYRTRDIYNVSFDRGYYYRHYGYYR
jgi:hypothetical protein